MGPRAAPPDSHGPFRTRLPSGQPRAALCRRQAGVPASLCCSCCWARPPLRWHRAAPGRGPGVARAVRRGRRRRSCRLCGARPWFETCRYVLTRPTGASSVGASVPAKPVHPTRQAPCATCVASRTEAARRALCRSCCLASFPDNGHPPPPWCVSRRRRDALSLSLPPLLSLSLSLCRSSAAARSSPAMSGRTVPEPSDVPGLPSCSCCWCDPGGLPPRPPLPPLCSRALPPSRCTYRTRPTGRRRVFARAVRRKSGGCGPPRRRPRSGGAATRPSLVRLYLTGRSECLPRRRACLSHVPSEWPSRLSHDGGDGRVLVQAGSNSGGAGNARDAPCAVRQRKQAMRGRTSSVRCARPWGGEA